MRVFAITKSLLLLSLGLPVVLGFASCTNPESSSTTTVVTAYGSFAYSSTTPVFTVPQGSNAYVLSLSGVSGKSVYLVKVNYGSTASAGGTALLADTGTARTTSADASTTSATALASSALSSSTGPTRKEFLPALTFAANPPGLSSASKNSLVSRSTSSASTSAYTSFGGATTAATYPYGTAHYSVGDSKTFFVDDYGTTTVTATLKAVGNRSYIWVDNNYFDSSSTSTTDGKITLTQAEALRDKFDGTSANIYNDGIYAWDTNVFGYEYGGGTFSTSSGSGTTNGNGTGGIDGDQHVSILVYDIGSDKRTDSGVFGYYWGKDEYPTSVCSYSNQAEMFYIDSYFYDESPSQVYSTLAHEFQHMIQFNQKSINQGLSTSTWFYEMCSMVAEDIVADKLGFSGSIWSKINGVTNTSYNASASSAPYWGRLFYHTYHYLDSGVTDWNNSTSDNAVYKSYASAYAFGGYLLRNYGGPALFSVLLSNSATDTAAITAALQSSGYSDSFNDALKHYGEAWIYASVPTGSSVKTWNIGSTLGTSSNYYTNYTPYTLSNTVTSGITYNINAVDVSMIPEYNLSSGWVKSSGNYICGYRVYAPSTAITVPATGVALQHQSSWENLGSSATLTIAMPTNTNVHVYVMVK